MQDGFEGRRHVDGDAVPGADVVPPVPTRCSPDSFEYLSVAVLRFREDQGHPVSPGCENLCEMFGQAERLVGRCAHPYRFPHPKKKDRRRPVSTLPGSKNAAVLCSEFMESLDFLAFPVGPGPFSSKKRGVNHLSGGDYIPIIIVFTRKRSETIVL
jgi:hypothetical protein